MIVDGGVERDVIGSSATAAERNGLRVVNNDAWSGVEADYEEAYVAIDRSGRKYELGVA